ncbi:hypothetical protein DMB44_03215 [Thermoplasma sp. Kam2015]|uniref:hypothetical protein n=1 Tax=Thermoplasma sp. Kam2015 TaxID=2094122 RepID=UPI000D902DC1|nr:hypothetical protein [Thermoplasma sp. Kam2015]PYB68630.1 hypothetical protein DMB44_03215 [Thermoplasma sp. Kam2015]
MELTTDDGIIFGEINVSRLHEKFAAKGCEEGCAYSDVLIEGGVSLLDNDTMIRLYVAYCNCHRWQDTFEIDGVQVSLTKDDGKEYKSQVFSIYNTTPELAVYDITVKYAGKLKLYVPSTYYVDGIQDIIRGMRINEQ